jgi:hypothetical protein
MKTFSIPAVGSKIRVTTRYRESYYFSTNPWRDTVFEGEVVNPNKWDGAECFKLFTGNPEFPNSVININSVYNIEYVEGGPARTINNDTRTWSVSGSKGDSYTVSQVGTKWSCTCSGFQFRRHCKHVKEKQDA